MSEKLIRQWVRDKLIEQQVSYDPSCQYEVDVNKRLADVGARSAYSPPSSPSFCYGTDTGGDAEFIALDAEGNSGVYPLELKAGSGNKRGESPGFSHPVAQNMLNAISAFNNYDHISSIVRRDIELTGRAVELSGDYDEVTEKTIKKITNFIVESQTSELSSQLSGTSKFKGLKLYYYFGRTGQAKSKLSIPKPFDLSSPDDSIIGTFENRYAGSGTNYIQIENAGLFYLGADPLNLESIGVRSFTGNIQTSGRYRLGASGGKTYWDLTVPALKGGNPVDINCKIRYKLFSFEAVEDLNVGKSTVSGINLDNNEHLQVFAAYVKQPAIRSKGATAESLIRDLIQGILVEGSTRGEVYEQTLVDAINNQSSINNRNDIQARIQSATKYDLDVNIAGASAKIEVKMGQKDQLGKVPKDMWQSLIWNITAEKLSGQPKQAGAHARSFGTLKDEHIAAGLLAVKEMNKSQHAKKQLKALASQYLLGDPSATEIDYTKPWPFVGGTPSKKTKAAAHSSGLPAPADTTTPGVIGNRTPTKQITTTHVILPAAEVQKIFRKVNYVIIGDGNESSVSGIIATTGANTLGINVLAAIFSDSTIEARWKSNQTNQDPYGFTMETRSTAGTTGGVRFNSAEELFTILTTPKAVSSRTDEALIRTIINNTLREELTKTDKKEIDKLIKKGIEKDRAAQKKIIQKELEIELKRSLGTSFFGNPGKIQKAIENTVRDELSREMKKGGDLEKSVVDITKKVLSAWHELLYKQQHIIQRVKI